MATVSIMKATYSDLEIETLLAPLGGMAQFVKRKENVISWANDKLERKEKIMGFGHRVYKTWDPRALILREISKKLMKDYRAGEHIDKILTVDIHDKVDFIFEMVEILSEHVIKTKKIYPNVDLYSAALLHILGIPTASFTPLFAAARSVGWVAHAIEQLSDNKLIRPRLAYIGNLDKQYTNILDR